MNSCRGVAYKKKKGGSLLCVAFCCVFYGASSPGSPHLRGFTITLRHTTFGGTPLDEWSARHTDHYFSTHNTHKRQTSMPPGGIRTCSLSRRAVADPRLRPRGHYNRISVPLCYPTFVKPLRGLRLFSRRSVEDKKSKRKEGRKEKYMEKGN
jgi:hypothetical protein